MISSFIEMMWYQKSLMSSYSIWIPELMYVFGRGLIHGWIYRGTPRPPPPDGNLGGGGREGGQNGLA